MRWLLHHSADKGHRDRRQGSYWESGTTFEAIASVISLIPVAAKPLSAAIGALPGSTPAGFCASQGSLFARC